MNYSLSSIAKFRLLSLLALLLATLPECLLTGAAAQTDQLTQRFNGVRYASQFGGGDIGAKVNAAGADCRWTCMVVISAGTYHNTSSVENPLNTSGKFVLWIQAGAVIIHSGSRCFVEPYEVSGSPTESNFEVVGYGARLVGTSKGTCGIHLLPTNGVKVHGLSILGFTHGYGILNEGSEVADIYDNFISGNEKGIVTRTTGCLTSPPYTCNSSLSGASVIRYDTNAMSFHNNVDAANVCWGIYEDGGTGGSTIRNLYENNDLESNGVGNDACGAIKLANNSVGAVIAKNYFENSPHYIVAGDQAHTADTLSIIDNHFTIPNAANRTIELARALRSIIQGNDELSTGRTNRCFIDLGPSVNGSLVLVNKIDSSSQFCNEGRPGVPADPAIIYIDQKGAFAVGVGPAVSNTGNLGRFFGTITTTASRSDNLDVLGMTQRGHCEIQATNATAASLTGVYCASEANSITIFHSASGGGTFNVFGTYN